VTVATAATAAAGAARRPPARRAGREDAGRPPCMIRHARTRRPALRARARQPGRSGRRGRPRAGPAPGAPGGAALPPRPARRAAPPSPLLHVSLSHPLRVCTAPTRGRGRVQLGWPDMRLPILYTMSWPERVPCSEATWPRLDFAKCAQLTFRPPDREKYPAMDLAYAAGRRAPARSFPRGSRAEAPCTGRLLLLRGKRLQLLGGEVPLPGGCGVKTASCLAVPLSLGGARGARRALLSLLDTCNLRAGGAQRCGPPPRAIIKRLLGASAAGNRPASRLRGRRGCARGPSAGARARRAGGTMTAVMSAANEKAVEIFLAERIGYLDIVPLVSACCEAHQQARPVRLAVCRARGGCLAPRPLGPRHVRPHREQTVMSQVAVPVHTFSA